MSNLDQNVLASMDEATKAISEARAKIAEVLATVPASSDVNEEMYEAINSLLSARLQIAEAEKSIWAGILANRDLD